MHQQGIVGRIQESRSVWHFLFKSEKIEKLEKYEDLAKRILAR